jgi:large subunit ribosomal protein L25
MITLDAKVREKKSRNATEIPAVVYGPGEKNFSLAVDAKEFRKVFREAGESSLVELIIEGNPASAKATAGQGKHPVLVQEIQREPMSGDIIHIDFYQPNLKKEVEVAVPLNFVGVAPAEKDLGGTLVKNISEIDVKALPQDLPHEIQIDISVLKTFEDRILIKDLKLPEKVTVSKNLDEIVASVLAPQNIEAELAQEITEDVEGVEKVEKEKKEEDVVTEGEAPAQAPKKEEKK